MKTQELRNLSREELASQLTALQQEYMGLYQSVRQGKESNHARLGQLRRAIARVKTLLREAADQAAGA